jgi:hypothetical protein
MGQRAIPQSAAALARLSGLVAMLVYNQVSLQGVAPLLAKQSGLW